jgi:hypothetical protein
MKEDFLQIIWQMQCFSLPAISTDGVAIHVIKPGIRNSSSGPDFSNARIHMDGLEWNGSVEIHVRSGEWKQHGHTSDPAYETVILHVVWEEDQPVYRKDGSRIPTLELRERLSLSVILRYRSLLAAKENLPCSDFLPGIHHLIPESMLDKALATRLERRARDLLKAHAAGGFSWKRSLALFLSRCLGMKGNEDAMEYLMENMPDVLLNRADTESEKIIAWLQGQSGLGFYEQDLALEKEYRYLKAAFKPVEKKLIWKKTGMRPGSFPLNRIKLLARMLPGLESFLHWLDEDVQGNPLGYRWPGLTELGEDSFLYRHLLVNFQATAIAAWSLHSNRPELSQNAIDLLHRLKAEENGNSRWLKSMGIPMRTSGHSQGGKELKDNWCQLKRCMECRIGMEILKGSDSGLLERDNQGSS